MKTIHTFAFIALLLMGVASCKKDDQTNVNFVDRDLPTAASPTVFDYSYWTMVGGMIPGKNVFYICNPRNCNQGQVGLWAYDIDKGVFTLKTTDDNLCACGYSSKMISDAHYLYYCANAFTRYSAATDTWESYNSYYPSSVRNVMGETGVCRVGDKIFFMCGRNAPTACEYFNTASNTWTNIAPFPIDTIRPGPNLATDGKFYIYALGGIRTGDNFAKLFYRYDIQNNSWQKLPDIPASAIVEYSINHACFFKEKYVAVVGGAYNAKTGLFSTKIYIFDTQGAQWLEPVDIGNISRGVLEPSADGNKMYYIYTLNGQMGIKEITVQ